MRRPSLWATHQPMSVLFIALLASTSSSITAQEVRAGKPEEKPPGLTVQASTEYVCADSVTTLTAMRGQQAVVASWTFTPALAGDLGGESGKTAVFHAMPSDGTASVYGSVTVSAQVGAERASKVIQLGGLCNTAFGGEVMRATLGFEQIGASGIQSAQKYAFDFFISRPISLPNYAPETIEDHYLGPPLRWWGDVRVASYPQQVTSDAATFASGFLTSAGKLTVNKLVQSAEFTTGFEYKITGLGMPVRGGSESTRQRFALMAFGAFGAVGPFPPPTDDPTAFVVPDAASTQGKAFVEANGVVSTKYVAFRAGLPDRFLVNLTGGLRLYTFYADRSATGEPLQASPATVSISVGRNDLIAPHRSDIWHLTAYYPLALGDRADPNTLVAYLFGDAWLSASSAHYSAPGYQLQAAVADGKPVPLSDAQVTILKAVDIPRDTYRVGVSMDLLKVWDRLVKPVEKPKASQ